MSLLKVSQKYHKWLMLFLGIQFAIWSVTGAYMVFFDIDYIHGDSLINEHQDKVNPNNIDYSLAQLYLNHPNAKQVTIGKFLDKEVYRFNIVTNSNKIRYLLDAKNGKLLSPLNENEALKAALYYYAGTGNVSHIELIREKPPFELSKRHLPAWRIDFNHFSAPSLYVSAQTGKLVTKRHQFWRLFDWMFRFHIMDYGDAEDASNSLLFYFALLGVLASFTGLVLMYFKVIKVQQKRLTPKCEATA
jgi:uncharacterized iron-regulated membrane protein